MRTNGAASERASFNANDESRNKASGAAAVARHLHSRFARSLPLPYLFFFSSYRLSRREGALLHLGARGLFFNFKEEKIKGKEERSDCINGFFFLGREQHRERAKLLIVWSLFRSCVKPRAMLRSSKRTRRADRPRRASERMA